MTIRPLSAELTDILFCVVSEPAMGMGDAPVFAKFRLGSRETVVSAELWSGGAKVLDLEQVSSQIAPRIEYWRTPGNTFYWLPNTEYVVQATVLSDRYPVFEATPETFFAVHPEGKNAAETRSRKYLLLAVGAIEQLEFGHNATGDKIVTATLDLTGGYAANTAYMTLWEDDLTVMPPNYTQTTAVFAKKQDLPNNRASYEAEYAWSEGVSYQFHAKLTKTLTFSPAETSFLDYSTPDNMP